MREFVLFFGTWCLLCLSFAPICVWGSLGDRFDQNYRNCRKRCHKKCDLENNLHKAYGFTENEIGLLSELSESQTKYIASKELDLSEKLFLWDCSSDCDYKCMMYAVKRNLRNGITFGASNQQVVQYHGKWPFIRVLGMQEIVSTRKMTRTNILMTYRIVAYIGVLSGLMSALFHCRDTWITERLDYHAALAYVFAGFSFHVVEFIYSRVSTASINMRSFRCIRASVFACSFLCWVAHVSYLNLIKFDYGWNMTVAVIFQLAQMLCWLKQYWPWYTFIRRRRLSPEIRANVLLHNHVFFGLTCFMLMIVAGLCEVLFEFPPLWFLVDTHAIFHMIGPFGVYMMNRFVVRENALRVELAAKHV